MAEKKSELRFAAVKKAELNLSHNKLTHTHSKLLPSEKSSDGKETKVDNFLDQIFQNGDAGQKYTQGSRSLKIDNQVLLDNYAQGRSVSTGSCLRALEIRSKRSKKHVHETNKNNGALYFPKEFHKPQIRIVLPKHEHLKNMMAHHLKKNWLNQFAQHFMDRLARCSSFSY